MIIGLAALMIYLFGGSAEMLFLNPEIKKNVKTYVADQQRKKDIYVIIKQIETDQESFLKKRKKVYAKKSSELNLNYASKRRDFEKLFNVYFEERKKLQSSYVDSELKIRAMIKEEEWQKIIGTVLEKPDNEKAQNSYLKASEKLFGDILKACEENISNATTQKEALRTVNEQKAEVNHFVDEFLNLNYRNLESLRKLNAGRSDFELVTAELNELRRKLLDHLIDMRFKLVDMTSEEEWKKLGKELDKLFSRGKNII